MEKIIFPDKEKASLKQRLRLNLPIYTIRVSNEYGKYEVGKTYNSNLDCDLIVVEEKYFIRLEQYQFYNELTTAQITLLKKYKRYHMLKLIKK